MTIPDFDAVFPLAASDRHFAGRFRQRKDEWQYAMTGEDRLRAGGMGQ